MLPPISNYKGSDICSEDQEPMPEEEVKVGARSPDLAVPVITCCDLQYLSSHALRLTAVEKISEHLTDLNAQCFVVCDVGT